MFEMEYAHRKMKRGLSCCSWGIAPVLCDWGCMGVGIAVQPFTVLLLQ